MQTLPTELHARIFIMCLPLGPYVEPSPRHAPLLLLRVCRRWRDVALRTPELWCSLDTIIDSDWQGLEPVRSEGIDFYETWLSRSGARPLSLALAFADNAWMIHDWVDFIRAYRRRFERLQIVDEYKVDLNELLQGSHSLEYLAIEARYEEGDRTLAMTHHHPNLRTLVLGLLHVTPASLPQASWGNLIRLAVRLPEEAVYEAGALLTLLDSCSRLERLVFGPVAATGPRRHPRLHKALRALSVVFDSYEGGSIHSDEEEENPLPELILPSVTALNVWVDFQGPLDDILCDEEFNPPEVCGRVGAGVVERTCSLMLEGSDGCFGMFDLCWATLTHLDVQVSGDTFMLGRILAACTSLQELSLVGRPCTARSTSLAEPLTHDRLAVLYVGVEAELGNLLSAATFSALRELEIRATDYGEPGDLLQFLVRSKCNLEFLLVRGRHSRAWTIAETVELRRLVPLIDPKKLGIQ